MTYPERREARRIVAAVYRGAIPEALTGLHRLHAHDEGRRQHARWERAILSTQERLPLRPRPPGVAGASGPGSGGTNAGPYERTAGPGKTPGMFPR